jgi:hypothetical protein
MLSSDNSGVFGWLLGLVVIVMIGVGLSMMVDRRFQFSSNNKEIESVISKEAEHFADLTARLPRTKAKLESQERPRQLTAREADELKLRLPISRNRIRDLKAAVSDLKTRISTLDDSMVSYRKAYRDQTWKEAVGEKHADLTLKTGKRYENTTIQRVTSVGLEISHKDGLARVDFTELDSAWQERFQWRFDERESTIAGEAANASSVDPLPQKPPIGKDEEAPDNVDKLRNDVIIWNTKVQTLKIQQSEAVSNASSGRNSVTGGLETWASKAERLTTELDRARLLRDQARARLEQAAPDDPLTKPLTGSN